MGRAVSLSVMIIEWAAAGLLGFGVVYTYLAHRQPPVDRELVVLRQLATGPKYGLELVAGSGGQLSRFTLYVLLSRMEDEGLIRGYTDPSSRRRYALTLRGERICQQREGAAP